MMKPDFGKLMWAMLLFAAMTATEGAAQEPKPQPPAKASAGQPAPASQGTPSAGPAPIRASAPAPKAPEFSPNQVVMKVGGDSVTVGDLDFAMRLLPPKVQSQIAMQGRKPMGEQYSMLIALSQKAAQQHLDQSEDFHWQMNLARMQYLANAEYKNIAAQSTVTPEEAKQYFDAHQADYAALEVRQISIRKKVGTATGGAPGLPEEEAKAKAEGIRKAIQSGTDFSKVAEQFKMPGVIFIDPSPRTVRHGQLPPNLEEAVFKLKDGELSDTTETPQVLYFMQVVKHTQPELKGFQDEIESKLKDEKTQAALENVKKEASVWMDPVYFATPTLPPAPQPEPVPAPAPAKAPSPAKPPRL